MCPRFLRRLLPALVLAALPAVSFAGVFVGVSVNFAPPPLPVYVQPPCPQYGYIWVPGYWAWGPYGYYWVPGTWVLPPQVGLFWTPGWWGWDADGDDYRWHAGYWGPQVGFYGGIDYGFGYYGTGFDGGYWRRGVFFYNRAVVNVGPRFVTNVYYRPVYHPEVRHVSFNGGRDGIRARPTPREMMAARERHFGMTGEQQRQIRMAGNERTLRANFNHGRPPIAATLRPAEFHGRGVIRARAAGGPMHMQGRPMQGRPMPAQQHAPRMRSDRPPWASGQGHQSRPMQPMQRGTPRGYGSPPRAAQPRYTPQRFQSPPQRRAPQPPQARQPQWQAPQRPAYRAPQNRFESRGYMPPQRQAMPQFHPPAQRFQGPQGGPRGGGRPAAQPRGRPEGRRGPPGRWH